MRRTLALILILAGAVLGASAQTITPNVSFQLPAYQQTNWQVPINYNFNVLDVLIGGYRNLPTGKTPTIGTNPTSTNWVTANTMATTITNFVGGFPGQTIRIICPSTDTVTSITKSATISIAQPFTCNTLGALSITLTQIGTIWYEVARGTTITGIQWSGAWSSTVTYSINDVVSYGGSSYISLINGNLDNEPDISPTDWALLAEGSSANPGGVSGDVQTNNGSGGLAGGTQLTALSKKPLAADAGCYVTANGNDSNDGLSWGSAKLTVYGCLLALPGGSSTTLTAGSGTIYLQSGTTGILSAPSANEQQGVLLLGNNDPHWANTMGSSGCTRSSNVVTCTTASAHGYITSPTGQWITVYGVTGGTTSFDGTFQITGGSTTTVTYNQTGSNESSNASVGAIMPAGFLHESGSINFIARGSVTPSNSPGATALQVNGTNAPLGGTPFGALELAGTNYHYLSDGIRWDGCIGVATGVTSNYTLTDNQAATFSFFMDHGGATVTFSNNIGCGPAFEIGSNVLWLQVKNSAIDALGQQSYSISSLTSVNNVVTVTLSSGPGGGGWQGGQAWKVGDCINVNSFSAAAYDSAPGSCYKIASVSSSTSFTYTASPLVTTCASTCGSGGTISLGNETDRRAAFLWNPAGGNSVLNYLEHLTLNDGGGIRANPGSGGSGTLFVDQIAQEAGGAGDAQPIYECTGAGGGVCPQATLRGLSYSDTGTLPPQVRITSTANANPTSTQIFCEIYDNSPYVQGPASTYGCTERYGFGSNTTMPLVSPLGQGQIGLSAVNNARDKVNAQDDNNERQGVPALARFSNLAASAPGSWNNVTGGNLTITTGESDQYGGTNAANLSVSTGNGEATSYSANQTPAAGDYYIAAVLAQSSSTAGWNTAFFENCPIELTFASATTRGLSNGNVGQQRVEGCPSAQDDGRWQWIVVWDSVNATGASQNVTLAHYVKTGFPGNFSHPLLYHIPLSSISPYSSTISSVSAAGGYALFTTSSSHSFIANQIVCIQGVSDTSFDGCQQIISVPSNTEILVAYSGASSSSTGGTAYATADSEAAEIALAVQPQWNTCSVGEWCTPEGLSLPNILASLDQTGVSTANSGSAQNVLASTPAAGKYRVSVYADESAGCTTVGLGALTVVLGWTDATHARVGATLTLTPTAADTGTGLYVNQSNDIWAASGSAITVTDTFVNCTTGTWTYDQHATVERLE